jgi:hypothetical protein
MPIHEVHAQSPHDSALSLEFLLNERTAEEWVYRRDARIRMPLKSAIVRDTGELPVLCPAIVLLFKSKNRRAKDDADFQRIRAALGGQQRRWLHESLRICDPEHPWLAHLHMTDAEDCPARLDSARRSQPDLPAHG